MFPTVISKPEQARALKREFLDGGFFSKSSGSEGLDVYDRDLSTFLSQDNAQLLYDAPDFSNKASRDSNLESSAGDNIRQFTCQCSKPGSPEQKCVSDDSDQLYKTLSHEDAFRIIEVLPGSSNDPVVCRLHVALLSEAVLSYTALSYTWKLDDSEHIGTHVRAFKRDTLKNVTISCNGSKVSIGKNLYQAIKRIRQPSTSQMLWADALCINQNDVQERTQQVQKMSLIFKNAFRLVVWLGGNDRSPEHDTHSMAFLGICRIINGWRKRNGRSARIPLATYSPLDPDQSHNTYDEPLAADDPIWLDIFRLYNRKWFRRVWVIQEVALARSATVLWGTCEIAWEWLGLAAAIIRTDYHRLAAPREGSRRIRIGLLNRQLNPRAVPTGVINAYFMYRISRSQAYFKAPRFSFHQLLTLTRQFRCEDPRDQVFGILGIPTIDQYSAQDIPFIIPDYTKPIAEVYHEVAAKILHGSDSLGLLSSVQHDERRWGPHSGKEYGYGYDAKLPSWIPQWRFVIARTLTPLEPSPNFNPAGGQCMQRKQQSNSNALVIRGIDVEMVSTVSTIGSFRRVSWTSGDSSSRS
ncbi:hypothetical protein NPX13_g5817 [Xylaria arbuscula]|uniref:Heterokaryon incompatibility domain-containing protein n=1 Tax=Xylaria arbuscula TaxID=114810 RepID=A0A9W8NDB8_9PEZI|nr:hypothetical protein NPX13_g5817 [Xylaria arbuscula]